MSTIAANAPSRTFARAAKPVLLSVSSEEHATNVTQLTVLLAYPLPTVAPLATLASLFPKVFALHAMWLAAPFAPPKIIAVSAPQEVLPTTAFSVSAVTFSSAILAVPTISAVIAITI